MSKLETAPRFANAEPIPTSETPSIDTRKAENAERLAAWRAKREKVAEAKREESLRIKEEERQERLRKFEADKAERIKATTEARAQEDAAARTARLASARAKLANRPDIDATRLRIAAHRKAVLNQTLIKLALAVFAPVAVVAWYLTAIATPLYEAEARFFLPGNSTAIAADDTGRTVLAAPMDRARIFLVRDMVASRDMMEHLDREIGLKIHFGDADPLTQIAASPVLGASAMDRYRRLVSASVNRVEGSAALRVRARDPGMAERVAAATLVALATRLEAAGAGKMTVYLPPSASKEPLYPRTGASLLLTAVLAGIAFAMVSVFLATLRRHART